MSSIGFVFDDDDVLDLLRTAIENEGGSAFAKHHGINRTYLNMVFSGKERPVVEAVAEALGLHKVYKVK